ncbi:MAG: radical SAM/SPASM domain-containing protein, partial [Nitrososphaeraceae archaeon]
MSKFKRLRETYSKWKIMKKNTLTKNSFLGFLLKDLKEQIARKSMIKKLNKKSLFLSTNIETYGFCNRKCSFCFNNDKFPKRKIGIMEEKLWKKIIDELASINFAGRISPYFYGEPLLDKRLPDLIQYARKKCKYSLILISTNGDLLSEDNFKKLIKSGVDRFLITNYEKKPQKNLEELQKKYPYWIKLRNIDEFSKQNRAGMIYKRKNKNIDKPCLRASTQLVVNWNGDVLLCCNDYYAKYNFGNLEKQ